MPKIAIDEPGCRACNLCVEICPVEVLVMDDAKGVAKVQKENDCLGCTSCQYICPSRCLTVSEFKEQRPFHRIEENQAIIAKFLQKMPAAKQLTEADYDDALRDVYVRLKALGDSINETMGRGFKSVGRKAGTLSAAHIPEMYEGKSLEEVLKKMSHRFPGAFDFESKAEGDGIVMTFTNCAIAGVVKKAGEQVCTALLCGLFHEYWAGLIAGFTQKNFNATATTSGDRCTVTLQART
jgi:NAD-dependent dihydropyrimidine dehydrogenase PreA subunit